MREKTSRLQGALVVVIGLSLAAAIGVGIVRGG